MTFDLRQLVIDMLKAARGILSGAWDEVSALTEPEVNAIAQRTLEIRALLIEEKISPEKAKVLMNLQAHNTKMVLIEAAGLSKLKAEQTVNAIFGSVAERVNSDVGWILIQPPG
jgi:glycine cleavage system pyridoxal-binding protein P